MRKLAMQHAHLREVRLEEVRVPEMSQDLLKQLRWSAREVLEWAHLVRLLQLCAEDVSKSLLHHDFGAEDHDFVTALQRIQWAMDRRDCCQLRENREQNSHPRSHSSP